MEAVGMKKNLYRSIAGTVKRSYTVAMSPILQIPSSAVENAKQKVVGILYKLFCPIIVVLSNFMKCYMIK